jgi:hypothetical protein
MFDASVRRFYEDLMKTDPKRVHLLTAMPPVIWGCELREFATFD